MTWKTNTRAAQKPKAHLALCKNCPEPCPHNNHYTPDGHCVKHDCAGFKSKDWKNVDKKIREEMRGHYFGSKHERLSLEDVHKAMARGESDVVSIDYQIPFKVGVGGIVYVADAVATLVEGKKYSHRIYEPKGRQTLIYQLKRRIVQMMYPHVEFVEISQ